MLSLTKKDAPELLRHVIPSWEAACPGAVHPPWESLSNLKPAKYWWVTGVPSWSGLHCDLNSFFQVNEIEAMNKYMEQNCRIENIFFCFFTSKSTFPKCGCDWEQKALHKHLSCQEGNTGAGAVPPACHHMFLHPPWAKLAPTITECRGKNSCLTSPVHNTHTWSQNTGPCDTYGKSPVDSHFYFWSIYLVSLTFSLVLPSMAAHKALILCVISFSSGWWQFINWNK